MERRGQRCLCHREERLGIRCRGRTLCTLQMRQSKPIWDGRRESHPSKLTTQQQMALSTTPSCPNGLSPWICYYIGCDAVTHKANSVFLRLHTPTTWLITLPNISPPSTTRATVQFSRASFQWNNRFSYAPISFIINFLYFYSLALGVWEYKL